MLAECMPQGGAKVGTRMVQRLAVTAAAGTRSAGRGPQGAGMVVGSGSLASSSCSQ